MVSEIVHLTSEEYKVIKEGINTLVSIVEIVENDNYDEIIAGRIYSLLDYKKYWIDQLREMFPFEGHINDLLWMLDQMD